MAVKFKVGDLVHHKREMSYRYKIIGVRKFDGYVQVQDLLSGYNFSWDFFPSDYFVLEQPIPKRSLEEFKSWL
jgi:hypothetical protein